MKRQIEYTSLDELIPAETNAKDHNAPVIKASIDRFGLIELPHVDERTGRIVAGHGRRDDLIARRAAGDAPPDDVTVRKDGAWMVPTVRGWASKNDDEARAAGIALNQSTIAGGWIRDTLFADLSHLAATEHGLDGTGFDALDLEALRVLADHPDDLDDLRRAHGDPGDKDFWPIIRLQVSPATKARWDQWQHDDPADNDDDLVTGLLDEAFGIGQ